MTNETTWLTVAGAAAHAQVSKDTIYTACERGELKHAKVGGRRAIRIRGPWVDAWLEGHVTAEPQGSTGRACTF